MSDAEATLKAALEEHPADWSIRWLVIDKMLARDAGEEAAELACAAPEPPETDGEMQRLAEIGGGACLPLVESYVTRNPADAYGHQLLAGLLDWAGKPEQAEQHRAVAAALSGQSMTLEPAPVHNTTPVDTSPQAGTPEQPAVSEQAPAYESLPLPPSPSSSSPPPIIPRAPESAANDEWAAATAAGRSRKTGRKATAVAVAIAVHLLIALVAVIIVILPEGRDEPEIVAMLAPPSTQKQEMQKKNVVKQTKKTSASAAAAAPLAQLMRANAAAKISMPEVTRISTGPLGMGDADFGSGGFGSGGDGLGVGASFFGGRSTGQRFLFVLDHSGSMTKQQVALRNAEVERALKSLNGVKYQVLLFAGGGFYAWEGWSVKRLKGRDNLVTGPKGTYKFTSKRNYADYEFEGSHAQLPRAQWIDATSSNVKKTMDIVKGRPLFGGTDWEVALRIGHVLEPPPDVIFFMADGTGGNAPGPILAVNSKHGKAVINTVAMQTTAGMAQFAEIARKTKGSFTIVDKRGKPIDGFEFQKDPKKFKGRL